MFQVGDTFVIPPGPWATESLFNKEFKVVRVCDQTSCKVKDLEDGHVYHCNVEALQTIYDNLMQPCPMVLDNHV